VPFSYLFEELFAKKNFASLPPPNILQKIKEISTSVSILPMNIQD